MKKEISLRQQRQARALRENLLKRKAQSRAKQQESSVSDLLDSSPSTSIKNDRNNVHSS